MKTFKIRVRAGGRIMDIEIQAPDSHAALNMARAQYGQANVLSAPVEKRQAIIIQATRVDVEELYSHL